MQLYTAIGDYLLGLVMLPSFRTLKRIASIQNHLLEINILPNLMPLTSSKQDEEISTQALLLVSCLLFNANTTVQVLTHVIYG